MRLRKCLPGLVLGLAWLGGFQAAWAQENKKPDEQKEVSAYDALWAKVAPRIAARDYLSASALLKNAQRDQALAQALELITADDQDIHRLVGLKKRVQDKCRGFTAGDNVLIGGGNYLLVRFLDDDKGERLVVKLKSDGPEREFYLEKLPPKTWFGLVEQDLAADADTKYLKGLFHAADRDGDREIARRHLKDTIATHPQALRWLERLDAVAKLEMEKKKEAGKEPIVGRWRFVAFEGNSSKVIVTSNITLLPKGRGEGGVSWRVDADGTYVINRPGGTIRVEIDDTGETFTGHSAQGNKCKGTRIK
jgi:hypothetical protein